MADLADIEKILSLARDILDLNPTCRLFLFALFLPKWLSEAKLRVKIYRIFSRCFAILFPVFAAKLRYALPFLAKFKWTTN